MRSHTDRRASAKTLISPGSVGKLEDDVIGQIVDFPQPEVKVNVVAIHEGLRIEETKLYKHMHTQVLLVFHNKKKRNKRLQCH